MQVGFHTTGRQCGQLAKFQLFTVACIQLSTLPNNTAKLQCYVTMLSCTYY